MRFTHRDAAVTATLTALCLAGNYATVSLPNVKIMDMVVFSAGFCCGAPVGMMVGALSWMIYGSLNPYGFAPTVWIGTMAGESVYGLVGGLLGRSNNRDSGGRAFPSRVELALWGVLLTLIYDIITNVAYAYTFNVPLPVAIATGWLIPPWFGVIHAVSNLVFFSIATVPIAKAVMSLRGTPIRSARTGQTASK